MLALFCACSTTASLARIKARAFAGSSSNLTIAPAISVPPVARTPWQQQIRPFVLRSGICNRRSSDAGILLTAACRIVTNNLKISKIETFLVKKAAAARSIDGDAEFLHQRPPALDVLGHEQIEPLGCPVGQRLDRGVDQRLPIGAIGERG